ncbi:uncharacterized protein TA05020 [Theileria annulata]|uniref:Uncharacterized protein n=1 Tax=Theileria annulata TaxID=5874 RepID=Q4UBR0_THEAN|nr:uncharacterized protein TA05020 [Theileria annulata]CAI75741.1 hypothetical protein, conserved [Theileria annulata]|eukprot:XP_955217.1 hypothetical protein, conserved [Theileria annulata]
MSSDFGGFDLHIQALEEWYKILTKGLKGDISPIKHKDLPKNKEKYNKTIESYKEKCLALCFVVNVSFINSVTESALFKSLCVSFFDKYYNDQYEPFLIFKFLTSNFKPTVEYSYIKMSSLKKGEYLFRLLRYYQNQIYYFRALQKFKAHYDIITMGIWCEFFDTKDRFWKYVDFSEPKFDNSAYSYSGSPRSNDKSYLSRPVKKLKDKNVNSNILSNDREIPFENNSESSYKGYLYIQRGRKMFIYSKNNRLEVKAIVLFPEYNYKTSRMLYVKEFPFELVNTAHSLKVSIANSNSGVTGSDKNLFILSCNICGIVSEITPKYVQECLLYQRKRSFIQWFEQFLQSINQRRISGLTSSFDKSGLNALNLAERLDVHLINANMLEKVDAKLIKTLTKTYPLPTKKAHFTNHPIYVLKSQIKKGVLSEGPPLTTFGNDLVYLRESLVEIKTKLGWYKENRRVIPDSKPIRTTESTHKIYEYYSFDQTEELKQEHIDEIDKFTINLSGNRHVPKNSVYIKSEYYENLEKILKRNRIFFKRAFSSLRYEGGTLKPKIDGVLISPSGLESFLKLYNEYVELISKNELFEDLEIAKFWKTVFKRLLNAPPVNKPQRYYAICSKINAETDEFLNQLN